MISVNHKIYPTQKQEAFLQECLWSSIGIENWAINQIKHDLDEHYFPLRFMKPKQLRSVLSGKIKYHSNRSGLASRLLNDCIGAVITSTKKHGINKLHFKSVRKKKSFYFNGDIKIDKKGRLKLPKLKTSLKLSEQNKFHGNLKKVTLIKKFDSWYACCVYSETRQKIEVTDSKLVGVDPGLKTALVLSDGKEICFPTFYKAQASRLAKLLAKLQRKAKHSKKQKFLARKVANQRDNHHHQLSTELAKSHQKVYWSNDNFKSLSKRFGKSYSELALGKFRDILANKLASRTDGLGELIKVSNKYSTQTCSACGTRCGPKGWDGLEVRTWTCTGCGCHHDRDVNAAINTLILGQGVSSVKGKSNKSSNIVLNQGPPSGTAGIDCA